MSSACKPYTSKDKWIVSVLSGLLFLLVSLPITYRLINYPLSMIGISIANKEGCPNLLGVGIMAIVFLLIVRLLMR